MPTTLSEKSEALEGGVGLPGLFFPFPFISYALSGTVPPPASKYIILVMASTNQSKIISKIWNY